MNSSNFYYDLYYDSKTSIDKLYDTQLLIGWDNFLANDNYLHNSNFFLPIQY